MIMATNKFVMSTNSINIANSRLSVLPGKAKKRLHASIIVSNS